MLEEEIVKIAKNNNPDNFNNLTRGEREALHDLIADKSIIIKGADK